MELLPASESNRSTERSKMNLTEYCVKCGKPMKEGAAFCVNCGAPRHQTDRRSGNQSNRPDPQGRTVPPVGISPEPQRSQTQQNRTAQANNPKVKRAKRPVWIPAVITTLILLLAVGGVFGWFALKSGKMTDAYWQYRSAISESGDPDLIARSEAQARRWASTGLFSISEREQILSELRMLAKAVENPEEVLKDQKERLAKFSAEAENYPESACASQYAALLAEAEEALAAGDKAATADALRLCEQALPALRSSVAFEIEGEEADRRIVLSSPVEIAPSTSATLTEPATTTEPETTEPPQPALPISIRVQQVDVHNYPEITLFLEIVNEQTGEVPTDLNQSMFLINKRDANGNYIRQTVTGLRQLNEHEPLSVVIAADVSDSMYGTPIEEAKSVMHSFLQSLQYHTGDEVALVSFSTGVRLERDFCGDVSLLTSDVDGLNTDSMTSLYDALYASVCSAAARSGARCVLAFTDGMDNYSNCTADDVIEVATRYNVPVFIVGVGSVDTGALQNICSQSGGRYYDVQDIPSMSQLYETIYRYEKDLYRLSFEDNTGMAVSDESEIELSCDSPEYEGSCSYNYQPSVLLDVEDANLYTSGPEHDVAMYIKTYAEARTQSSMNPIAPYILYDSKFYRDQKKFIENNPAGLTLESYEIVSTDYRSSDECVVTTRETYYVQGRTTLQLVVQQCKYVVASYGGEWLITDFAENVKVLQKINQ